MKARRLLQALLQHEQLNFLLTNRIPRIALTHAMGRFSRIRSPWLARLSIGVWKQFTDLDLSEAQASRFDSLHDCFIRELKHGARTVDADPSVLASPCDAIVGECGAMQGTTLFQAKGFPYRLADLFGRRGRGTGLRRRLLRHAAPALRHVPPLPCAAWRPHRTGHAPQRRHLERQPDRAEAH